MSLPAASELLAVVDATWPAASYRGVGPWIVREGAGGGKRVSAATAAAPVRDADIATAEKAARSLGQTPLFMIRAEDAALDHILAARGYEVIDPVDIFVAEIADLDLPAPARLTAIEVWPPLAIMREIWAEGGIGPARIAVMERAAGPRTTLLGRFRDRAVATAFVAIHDRTAMIHALEVLPDYRRQGIARTLVAGAAHWAARHGAVYLSLVVTRANVGAQALYSSLGFSRVGQYHYRIKTG